MGGYKAWRNFRESLKAEVQLRRITLPRTSVNKGIEKGQVPLQKHCDRCGCRESLLGSDHQRRHSLRRGSQVSPLQHSLSSVHGSELGVQQVLPFSQELPKLQHGSPAAQEPPGERQVRQMPVVLPEGRLQILLQQSVSVVQGARSGRHPGVVVEVVVVGVVVVEVVEVVEVVVELVVPPHGPQVSRGWFLRWASRAFLGMHSVCALLGFPGGLWQMNGSLHFSGLPCPPPCPCPPARAREGISAAMALPAKSFSARRRLIEPSTRPLASSSKERSVVRLAIDCLLRRTGR
jgi:hypothetical protein